MITTASTSVGAVLFSYLCMKYNTMGLGLNEVSATRPLPVAANDSSIASDGTLLQVDDLAQTFSYNVDGTLNYIQVTQSGSNYRQTYGYTDGRITSISNWVKQ